MIQSIGICTFGEKGIYLREAGFLERFKLILRGVMHAIKQRLIHE